MYFDLTALERGINSGAFRQGAPVLGLTETSREQGDVQRWACLAPHQINPIDRLCLHIKTSRWKSRQRLAGFDHGGWRQCQKQFVPVDGQRRVELRGESHRPVQLFNEHPDIASVRALEDGYAIKGLAEGRARLHPINRRGRCHNLLEVVVRRERLLKIIFHRVRYPGEATYRSPYDRELQALVAGVQAIFRPQTGLYFEKITDGPELELPSRPAAKGLNPHADFEPFRQHARPFEGLLNVFLVRQIRRVGAHLVGGEVHANCIFLSPEAGRGAEAARRLAHEIGHYLTQTAPEKLYDDSGHAIGPDSLMHPFAKGSFVSQVEADCMIEYATNNKLTR